MTQRSRKGWIRLGIVLSIGWLVVALAYATLDFSRVSAKEAGWETVGNSNALPFETVPISLFTECHGYGGGGVPTTCSPRYLNVALLVLVPVALGWALVLAVVYATLWIRAGFRDKNT